MIAWLGCCVAWSLAVSAGPSNLEIHGFVSQGGIKSTANNYLARSKRGSVEFTEVALNLTQPLGEDLRAGMQLFARDLGPVGNYDAKFDWFYLDWHRVDWLGLRAGRIRIPYGLFNETSDYDPGRVSILLPQSLYPTTSREFLLALTGGEAYGVVPLAAAGTLDYRAYGGTIFLDVSEAENPTKVDVPYTAGARVLWETPLPTLRLGASVLVLRLDADITIADQPVSADLPATLWVGSAEYLIADLKLSAEYGRWYVKLDSSNPALLPNADVVSERYHVMASYAATSWLQTGAYYSGYFRDIDTREGPDAYQHDVAGTVRFDLDEHWLVKLEAHYLHGTADLRANLNKKPRTKLTRDWGLFLLKTTAYF